MPLRFMLLVASGLASAMVHAGQTITEQYADARGIVEQAHVAAGGDHWARPRTLHLRGRAVFYRDGLLASRVVADDYAMWRVFPEWTQAARQASGKVRIDALSDKRVLFQLSFDGERSYNQHGLIPEAEASREWSAAFGFGIIRFALGEGFSLDRLADDQVEGHSAFVIAVHDPEGHETLFWIDQENHAIRKVGFETPRGWHERIYSEFQYHDDPRFQQPTRVRLYYRGRLTTDIEWLHYEVNRPIAERLFVIDPEETRP